VPCHTSRTRNRSEIKKLVEKEANIHITEMEKLSSSEVFSAFKISLKSSQTLFLKGYTKVNYDEPVRLLREISVLKRLSEFNLDFVPRFVSGSVDKSTSQGYILTEYVSGNEVTRTTLLTQEFIRSLAEHVAHIHQKYLNYITQYMILLLFLLIQSRTLDKHIEKTTTNLSI